MSSAIKNTTKQLEITSRIDVELPMFAKEGYLKSKSSSYGWLMSDSYFIPYIIDKRLIFSRLVFTSAPIKLSKDSSENEDEFLQLVIEFLRVNKLCDFIGKAQSNSVFKCVPKEVNVVPWGTYILDLGQSESDIISGYHKKHRNVIKKAEKDGVAIVFGDSVDAVYNNIKETLRRQNSPYFPSLSFLRGLQKNVPENVLFASAYKNGELQGTAVVMYDNRQGFYLYGGSSPKPVTGSVNFLHHCIILHLKSLGLSSYDFVGARLNVESGSKFEGIQRFKSRFGCHLDKGYAFNVIFSPTKFWLYNLLLKCYFFMKGVDYSDPISQLVEKDNKI